MICNLGDPMSLRHPVDKLIVFLLCVWVGCVHTQHTNAHTHTNTHSHSHTNGTDTHARIEPVLQRAFAAASSWMSSAPWFEALFGFCEGPNYAENRAHFALSPDGFLVGANLCQCLVCNVVASPQQPDSQVCSPFVWDCVHTTHRSVVGYCCECKCVCVRTGVQQCAAAEPAHVRRKFWDSQPRRAATALCRRWRRECRWARTAFPAFGRPYWCVCAAV